MRKARVIELSEEQRERLEKVVRARCTEVRVAERCRVVLLAEKGLSDTAIGQRLAISRQKAARCGGVLRSWAWRAWSATARGVAARRR